MANINELGKSITMRDLWHKGKEATKEVADTVIETVRESKYAPLNTAKLVNLGLAKTIATVTGKKVTRQQYYDPESHLWEEVEPLWNDDEEEEEVQSEKKEDELPDLDKLSDEQIMMVVLKNKERLQKLFGEKTE